MHRPVAGRGTQHHDVDVGGDQPAERVKPHEAVVRLDFDAALQLVHQVIARHLPLRAVPLDHDAGVPSEQPRSAQPPQARFELVFEHVRHRDEVDVFGSGQQVYHRLRAAPAAAHQAGAQPLFPGAAHQLRADEGECGAGRGGRAQYGPSGYVIAHESNDTRFPPPLRNVRKVSCRVLRLRSTMRRKGVRRRLLKFREHEGEHYVRKGCRHHNAQGGRRNEGENGDGGVRLAHCRLHCRIHRVVHSGEETACHLRGTLAAHVPGHAQAIAAAL